MNKENKSYCNFCQEYVSKALESKLKQNKKKVLICFNCVKHATAILKDEHAKENRKNGFEDDFAS